MLTKQLAAFVFLSASCLPCLGAEPEYAIVVSRATHDDASWQKVVAALNAKYRARVIVYDQLAASRKPLTKLFPRYACFVATSAEATRTFVAQVHQLTRRLDDDPYTDLQWGVLTGFDAANALEIAQHTEPLTVRRVAAGTEVALEKCQEGKWYCELNKNKLVRKPPGGIPREEVGPADTTQALVDTLNHEEPDLFVTSGHATERDWQIGFRYRNGQFRSRGGQLIGVDTREKEFPIQASNPKVYLPIGNCLMGHIDGPDAMALAWMNSAGVRQMIGYTVLTWYGYGGWGCLDYFVEQPGRYTFTEAFFANQHALVHRLETEFPQLARRNPPPGERTASNDGGGLLHDRDVVVFYGDPAWQATMAPGDLAWEQTLSENDGIFSLEIRPKLGTDTFQPVNTNGSQRGWRPIVHFLPFRVKDIQLISGQDLKPVVTDNFVLVPNPRECDPTKEYRIEFRAARVR